MNPNPDETVKLWNCCCCAAATLFVEMLHVLRMRVFLRTSDRIQTYQHNQHCHMKATENRGKSWMVNKNNAAMREKRSRKRVRNREPWISAKQWSENKLSRKGTSQERPERELLRGWCSVSVWGGVDTYIYPQTHTSRYTHCQPCHRQHTNDMCCRSGSQSLLSRKRKEDKEGRNSSSPVSRNQHRELRRDEWWYAFNYISSTKRGRHMWGNKHNQNAFRVEYEIVVFPRNPTHLLYQTLNERTNASVPHVRRNPAKHLQANAAYVCERREISESSVHWLTYNTPLTYSLSLSSSSSWNLEQNSSTTVMSKMSLEHCINWRCF